MLLVISFLPSGILLHLSYQKCSRTLYLAWDNTQTLYYSSSSLFGQRKKERINLTPRETYFSSLRALKGGEGGNEREGINKRSLSCSHSDHDPGFDIFHSFHGVCVCVLVPVLDIFTTSCLSLQMQKVLSCPFSRSTNCSRLELF